MADRFRLSKKDWNKLDELLSKHGFGGYYDLIECLKDIARRIGIQNTGVKLYSENRSVSLPQIIQFLQDWTLILYRNPEFLEITEKIAEECYIEKAKRGTR